MDAVSEAGATVTHVEASPLSVVPDPLVERREAARLQARVVSSRISLRARVAAIWQARELLWFLIRKELKVKYKGSVLGFVWSMLNPAIVLFVYYVVFRYFLKSQVPDFALFLFCGLLIWNLYSTALVGSSSVIVANAGIVKKVAFPREVLALSQVGTAVVFFFFQTLVLVLFLAGFRYEPAWSYLPLVAFAILDTVVFTAAIAVFLSAVNVYLRDVEHLVAVLLQAWFWGVPIIYSFNRVYDHHHWLGYLYLADPLTPIILTFQRAIYGKVFVGGGAILANYPYHFYVAMLGWVLAIGIAALVAAMTVFGRIEGNFAEEL